MSDLHPMQANVDSKTLEEVGEKFVVEGLIRARSNTIKLYEEIKSELKPGLTEDEARRLGMKIALDHYGIKKHWHKVYIRFGAGTCLTFNDPLQPDYRLEMNDPFYLDLGPVWRDEMTGIEYEGDYGKTEVLGVNPEASLCIQASRQIFDECRVEWKREALHGDAIYSFASQRAQELGYELVTGVDGHRVSDFPHHKYTKAGLAKMNFTPQEALWVLEVMIRDPGQRFGAFYEDLL